MKNKEKEGHEKVGNNHDSALAYALGSKSYDDHKEEINEYAKIYREENKGKDKECKKKTL